MDTIEFYTVCGVLAFVLSVAAYAPLAIGAWRGTRSPKRETWLIWTVLATISAFSSIYEGATNTAAFGIAHAMGTGVIFLLALRRARGVSMTSIDRIILGLSAIGVGVWFLTESAVFALALSICVSAAGGVLAVAKSVREPGGDSMTTWWLSLASAGFAVLAVGRLEPVLLAYPAYLFMLYAALIAAVSIGRIRERITSASARPRSAVALAPRIGRLLPGDALLAAAPLKPSRP